MTVYVCSDMTSTGDLWEEDVAVGKERKKEKAKAKEKLMEVEE